MKFSKGFWTHESFMDVFVEIEDVVGQGEKGSILRIKWWNKGGYQDQFAGFIKPFCIGIRGRIVVKEKDYDKWTPYLVNSKQS